MYFQDMTVIVSILFKAANILITEVETIFFLSVTDFEEK